MQNRVSDGACMCSGKIFEFSAHSTYGNYCRWNSNNLQHATTDIRCETTHPSATTRTGTGVAKAPSDANNTPPCVNTHTCACCSHGTAAAGGVALRIFTLPLLRHISLALGLGSNSNAVGVKRWRYACDTLRIKQLQGRVELEY